MSREMPSPEEFKVLSKRVVENLGRKIEILSGRYHECDSQGHCKPDQQADECGYCYRRLGSYTPETEALLKEREKLHWYDQPIDAPFISDEFAREESHNRWIEFWSVGLGKLEKELGM